MCVCVFAYIQIRTKKQHTHGQTPRGGREGWRETCRDAVHACLSIICLNICRIGALVNTVTYSGSSAQELSDHPAAARIAQAIYNICLPLLMMVGAVVVSWLAVNVLVPLAARLGLSLNEAGDLPQGHPCNPDVFEQAVEAGRRRRAHAKLLSRARAALEGALSQATGPT